MPETTINYGTYLLATRAFEDADARIHWDEGDIALVFSRSPRSGKPAASFDLLFENGRTIFGAEATLVADHFEPVHADPEFVIDGCSTNPGWELARRKVPGQGRS